MAYQINRGRYKRADLMVGDAPEPEQEQPIPTASEGAHPSAISQAEGLPTVPQQALLAKLQKLLVLKYTAVLMYMNYGDRLRSHFRDTIYDHFQEHLKEEREACYDLAMKITALAGEPTPKITKIPDINDLHTIFMTIMSQEQDLIHTTREIIALCGEYVGLRVLLENMLVLDQRHLDDARRMLLCESPPAM